MITFIETPKHHKQAPADRESTAGKQYHEKNFEFSKRRILLTKQFEEIHNISIEDLRKLSKKELAEHNEKTIAHKKKRDAFWDEFEAHHKTRPVYPADAYKRTKELRQSMLENNQLHFSKDKETNINTNQ